MKFLEHFFNIYNDYPSVVMIDGKPQCYGRLVHYYNKESIAEFAKLVIEDKWWIKRVNALELFRSQEIKAQFHSLNLISDYLFCMFVVLIGVIIVGEKVTACPLYSKLLP